MSVRTVNDNSLKAAISVSKMCKLLSMSRSQFYWHVRKGTFHSALTLPTNGRPYYNASMVEDNLKARDMGIGVNGLFVIFYERTDDTSAKTVPPSKSKKDCSELMNSLQALGLSGLTTDIVKEAVSDCYPKETTGQNEQDILRTVFRHIKRQGTA